jgi:hypothetical protein
MIRMKFDCPSWWLAVSHGKNVEWFVFDRIVCLTSGSKSLEVTLRQISIHVSDDSLVGAGSRQAKAVPEL